MTHMSLAPLALLALAGVRAIPVTHLGREAWYVVEASIVLIDASLDREAVERVAAEVLAQTLDLAEAPEDAPLH